MIAGTPVTATTSSNTTVIVTVSPIPYSPAVALTLEISGVSPSITIVPGSTAPRPAGPPAASVIDPVNPVIVKSVASVSPSATV